MGTFLYIAPEILEKLDFNEFGVEPKEPLGDYDLMVDIYSLSIIFWEVYYRQRAYEDDIRDLNDLADAIVNEGYRPYIEPGPTR